MWSRVGGYSGVDRGNGSELVKVNEARWEVKMSIQWLQSEEAAQRRNPFLSPVRRAGSVKTPTNSN
jgi:hypothetical protein